MLAANLLLALLVLGFGIFGLAVFFIALFRGQFDDLGAQQESIFDECDRRYWRVWESPEQEVERRREYGSPLSAAPWEWGGSA